MKYSLGMEMPLSVRCVNVTVSYCIYHFHYLTIKKPTNKISSYTPCRGYLPIQWSKL